MNICIWSLRKSAGHEINDRAMVHGDGTRADGRRSSHPAHNPLIVGSRDQRGDGAFGNRKSNVGHAQANYLAHTTTKAPETQIYFINHRSGAFPVLRQRTVVRGERASRSIVNRTTALWSIWMVSSLILAGLVYFVVFVQTRGTEVVESRGDSGPPKAVPQYAFNRPRWNPPLTNGRKRT